VGSKWEGVFLGHYSRVEFHSGGELTFQLVFDTGLGNPETGNWSLEGDRLFFEHGIVQNHAVIVGDMIQGVTRTRLGEGPFQFRLRPVAPSK
jgi:hypothetical protein